MCALLCLYLLIAYWLMYAQRIRQWHERCDEYSKRAW